MLNYYLSVIYICSLKDYDLCNCASPTVIMKCVISTTPKFDKPLITFINHDVKIIIKSHNTNIGS